ncbi:unnamed protein product [Sphagnum jensenii]|uniref:Cytochrome c oxidase assembly factor 6 n=1 Tax=Sphagnum jensenii TaxID=128206 RepID=A0ABP1AB51_9BRYO
MASLQEKGVSGVERDVLASGRNACYKARDAFFRCVEADAGHTTPTEVASVGLLYPSQCKTLRANYEQLCRSTWVKHFDRQFCARKRTKRLLDTDIGARPISPQQKTTIGLQPGGK